MPWHKDIQWLDINTSVTWRKDIISDHWISLRQVTEVFLSSHWMSLCQGTKYLYIRSLNIFTSGHWSIYVKSLNIFMSRHWISLCQITEYLYVVTDFLGSNHWISLCQDTEYLRPSPLVGRLWNYYHVRHPANVITTPLASNSKTSKKQFFLFNYIDFLLRVLFITSLRGAGIVQWLERKTRDFFLLVLSRINSVLTLILVSLLPPWYRSST